MSKTDSVIAVLKRAVGNASAAIMLERMVFWSTRQKGGVTHEGRLWSYRSQKEWIELAGLKERTGKTVFKRLADDGYILAEMRIGGPKGNRRTMMHVALSDKTYILLFEAGISHLEAPILAASQAMKDHVAKVAAE